MFPWFRSQPKRILWMPPLKNARDTRCLCSSRESVAWNVKYVFYSDRMALRYVSAVLYLWIHSSLKLPSLIPHIFNNHTCAISLPGVTLYRWQMDELFHPVGQKIKIRISLQYPLPKKRHCVEGMPMIRWFFMWKDRPYIMTCSSWQVQSLPEVTKTAGFGAPFNKVLMHLTGN